MWKLALLFRFSTHKSFAKRRFAGIQGYGSVPGRKWEGRPGTLLEIDGLFRARHCSSRSEEAYVAWFTQGYGADTTDAFGRIPRGFVRRLSAKSSKGSREDL